MNRVFVAVGVGAAAAVLTHPAIWAIEHWVHGMGAPLPAPPLLGWGETMYWLPALVAGTAAGAWLAAFPARTGARVAAALIAISSVAALASGVVSGGAGLSALDAWRFVPDLALVAGIFTGGLIALGREVKAQGSRRLLVAAPALMIALLAVPDLLRDGRLPECEPMRAPSLRLVAAYPPVANTVVTSAGPEAVRWVEAGGRRYQLDVADSVALGPDDVRCVRWYADRRGIGLLPRGAAFWSTYRRSLRRMSQLDAVLIGDEVVAVPLYESLASRGLYFEWPEPQAGAAQRFHELLTRAPAAR